MDPHRSKRRIDEDVHSTPKNVLLAPTVTNSNEKKLLFITVIFSLSQLLSNLKQKQQTTTLSMAIMRTRTHFASSSSQAPPPSPIPTGKGSRSAANSIFSDYLDRSLQIPQLSLPRYLHHSVPDDIDFQSLASRDDDSVMSLLRSATEFGLFRISGHGIGVEDLRKTLDEGADLVFQIEDDRKIDYCRYYGGCEELLWRHFEEAVAERAGKLAGAEKYTTLRQKMDSAAHKLEVIAAELGQIISESVNKEMTPKEIEPRESILSLYRFKQPITAGESPTLSNEENPRPSSYEHALSLHLPLDQCEFHVQMEHGPLSFNASPDTIVATVGKQLEEWSLGEFKSPYGKLNLEPKHTRAPFSIELKCSPLNFTLGPGKIIKRTIPIADQILFTVIFTLLYKFFVFIFS